MSSEKPMTEILSAFDSEAAIEHYKRYRDSEDPDLAEPDFLSKLQSWRPEDLKLLRSEIEKNFQNRFVHKSDSPTHAFNQTLHDFLRFAGGKQVLGDLVSKKRDEVRIYPFYMRIACWPTLWLRCIGQCVNGSFDEGACAGSCRGGVAALPAAG